MPEYLSSQSAYKAIVSITDSFGISALLILTAIIGVGVGLLVFRWGWRKIHGLEYGDVGWFKPTGDEFYDEISRNGW